MYENCMFSFKKQFTVVLTWCHPKDDIRYDFFLVSQHVKQGTVTPTHYQVIEDTLKLPPDIMQKLTYKLTHMYYNWSGTVRVPAPCQLAHKLAFLTGQTLKTSPNNGLDELLYYL